MLSTRKSVMATTFGVIFLVLLGACSFVKQTEPSLQQEESASSTTVELADLPKVSSTDWELVLVNRSYPKAELNPDLVEVNGVFVDRRIENDVRQFLAAAQSISSNEQLISAYRSVAYQEQVYNGYVERELLGDPSLSRDEAEKIVQTFSQPPGASEHQTGLAFDMSTTPNLDGSDEAIAKQVQQLAATYGFVLRFPKDKTIITGIAYENWHYRYVGKISAAYMVKHNLALEEYIELLKENGQ
ncbi:D-alanyl-D-alanine carboxypeptidase family protein [Streptococcus sp. sy018]|uniref:M15 family metallopeptidase n=1 Tax=Streptococcus sp. sy018 TaxID=2600147 RepID=UPI0011B41BF9|nr:M15 family metallopeptidase [Streptococcus sp. sy018]TWS94091.1 D-alanyl-D-alanine carboxypeptidase family protein [Streptococcus sp. sy018]